MLKALQKRTKRADFVGGVDVERAGQHAGLVGDDADRPALQAAKADDDVRRQSPAEFQENPRSSTTRLMTSRTS